MKTQTKNPLITRLLIPVIGLCLAGVSHVQAASQTWSNAPINANWNVTNNWVGQALPGALNLTGNTVNNDVATFNTPIAGTIGSGANPILIDDATTLNTRSRQLGGITFDTASCGAYVFSSLSPAALPTATTVETGILNVSHNNSILINTNVTTSQTFLVPVFVRLPASTAGIYNFVNNAPSASVVLYIGAVTNDSANTRGTDFRLGGSNTGTNTIGFLSAGTTTTGVNGLTKQGTGTWILPNDNDFRTGTAINIIQGTLIVKSAGVFSIATTATVTNGVLQIEGVTLSQNSLNIRNGGNIRMNGTASLNGLAVGTQVGTVATLSTTSASDVFTVGTGIAAGALVSAGAADSVLTTAGPGTLLFSQGNTYVGKWAFNAKTNQITNPSALGTGANANVGAGAILDLTPMGPTTFTPTTAGLGGNGTGVAVGSTAAAILADGGTTVDLTSKAVNLTYTPTVFSGDTTHPALYIAQGALSLNGNTFFVNNAGGTALGAGTYRLIQQASGSVTDGGGYAVIVSGSGLASGMAAVIAVSGGNVNLVVSPYVPKNLVWTGGNPDAVWNTGGSANFLNGAAHTVFTSSDNVTFNSVGSTNPTVTLSGTLSPGTVLVDASANSYTFNGSGQIAGTTALTKIGANALILQTVNSYGGGTVISNGTLQLATPNAISATGNGDVSVYGTGKIDMNNFDNAINGLIGDGTVDNLSGALSTLTVGNNDKSGTFTGVLKNSGVGTLALAKVGLGTETLTASNSYAGATTLNAGTLATVNDRALGLSDVSINAGILDVRSSTLTVNSLAGTGGVIANNTTATTNRVIVAGTNTTIFGGNMIDGSGGGGMALTVLGGVLTMSGQNTYSGGTVVASGATFNIPNGPAAVTGGVIASNGATLGLTGGSSTPGTPNQVTSVDGATVIFTAGAEGKIWQAQFVGAANTTNRITTTMSFGQTNSFQNFLGLVRFEGAGNIRFFNGGSTSGGDNTIFEFAGSNIIHTRDQQSTTFGQIRGGFNGTSGGVSGIDAATTAGALDTWVIGAKNTDSIFEGYVRGSNNLVKVGTGKLVFDGAQVITNTDSATFTNFTLADSLTTFFGSTTVSNGTLALVVPNNLTNSSPITLAADTAILDMTKVGSVSNILDENLIPTNSVLITNGLFALANGQILGGLGTVLASNVTADATTTIAPGLDTNSFGNLIIRGKLVADGAVNLKVGHPSSAQSDKLTSTNFVLNGTINVTQGGANDLLTGDTFTLFSGPVTGPATNAVTLPLQNAGATVTYVWTNRLAIDGTIRVLAGGSPSVNTNSTNITFTATGGQLTLSWPADHTGWRLQAETNSLAQGLRTNWVDVAGSTATNQFIMPIDKNNGAVFFRITYP